ncbi:MAG: acetylornithine deacetylase [Marinicellaceae bacterium]
MINNILKNLDFLIQQDTQNPPRKICQDDLLYQHLTSHFGSFGFEVEITDLGEGHVIFYAKKGKPSVLFNVHLDTVPVTSSTLDDWNHDPFKLTIDAGKAYGRGSCDIKGAAACLMELAKSYDNMAVLFTSDEEGANGCCVKNFIKETDLSQYHQMVIAEPTLSQAVLSHRGYLSTYVEFYGECGHSSMAIALKSNAIHKANHWLTNALEYAQSFVNDQNPAGICFNVGVVKGGEKNNMIAEKVNLDFSARVPAGMSSKQVFDELKAFDSESRWTAGMMAPPLPADNQNDKSALEFCKEHHLQIANPVDFWTEAALFSQAGFPAIVLGPGNIKQAHTIDEWVEVSQLEKIAHIYAGILDHEN